VVTVGAGLIVAELERGTPDVSIQSMSDGLWWAITTVTTVGYGDAIPQTAVGRGFAVLLMLVGVGLFGLLAASLASFLIDRDLPEPEEVAAFREIKERLDRIERLLDPDHRNQ
jgi:voltage-gated potassium channel